MADERKSDAGHRQRPQNAANVDQRLKTHKSCKPGSAELGKHITRIKRSANTGYDKDNDSEDHGRATNQAQLLANGRIDIIRVRYRNHFRITKTESSTGCFPGSDAKDSLSGLKSKFVKPYIDIHSFLDGRTLLGQ